MKNIFGFRVHLFRYQCRNISLDRKLMRAYKKNRLTRLAELLDYAEKTGRGARKYELTPLSEAEGKGGGAFGPGSLLFCPIMVSKKIP
jgi:hypothetical protein